MASDEQIESCRAGEDVDQTRCQNQSLQFDEDLRMR
jgi:hypothetical protein